MTKEEKKKIYMKAYRLANKEKIAAKQREYKKANKEKIAKYDKEYIRDKEKKRISDRKYRFNNKEKIAEQKKRQQEANKLPYNVIYCIPNYNGLGDNYCGVTYDIVSRMRNHKSQGKHNVSDWFILDIVIDRKHAEISEGRFHYKGYHGAKY